MNLVSFRDFLTLPSCALSWASILQEFPSGCNIVPPFRMSQEMKGFIWEEIATTTVCVVGWDTCFGLLSNLSKKKVILMASTTYMELGAPRIGIGFQKWSLL